MPSRAVSASMGELESNLADVVCVSTDAAFLILSRFAPGFCPAPEAIACSQIAAIR
jgi:hypothetical protein